MMKTARRHMASDHLIGPISSIPFDSLICNTFRLWKEFVRKFLEQKKSFGSEKRI